MHSCVSKFTTWLTKLNCIIWPISEYCILLLHESMGFYLSKVLQVLILLTIYNWSHTIWIVCTCTSGRIDRHIVEHLQWHYNIILCKQWAIIHTLPFNEDSNSFNHHMCMRWLLPLTGTGTNIPMTLISVCTEQLGCGQKFGFPLNVCVYNYIHDGCWNSAN